MRKLAQPDLLKNQLYIDGQWCSAYSNTLFSVDNPATESTLTQVANATAEDAKRAVTAAHHALGSWRSTPVKERAAVLHRWHTAILDNLDDLAALLTLEQGKPLAEAKAEIRYGARYFEWFAEEAKRIQGDIIAPPTPNHRLWVNKVPVGVVAAITPWNFPNAMLARKIAPALAAGCTVVAKPAAETPLSALALMALGHAVGVPKGVVNMLPTTQAEEVGRVLTQHPQVRKLTFTGSTQTGKHLLKACADTVKRTSMELGGNAPFLVFEDASIGDAVHGALLSKFRNAGQTCISANRFLVHESISDTFTQALTQAVNELTCGSGFEPKTQIGPLIHARAAQRIQQWVDDAQKDGAMIHTQSSKIKVGPTFYPPTVISNVQPHHDLVCQEIFGPVAPIQTFATDQEAIALANSTPYGLAAYVYTRDMARIFHVSEALEFGMIGINEGMISNEMAPFGGVKASGFGREGSRYGLEDYLDVQSVCLSTQAHSD